MSKTVYTIGHSTRSLEEFIEILKSFEIEVLADIRHYPGSRKFPWFNKDNLEKVIPENGMQYVHIKALGGRRKVHKDSKNTRWRNDSFRAYADYMETEGFTKGMLELIELSENKKTAYMCSEAVWWRCHRSMVSDWLKAKGWTVMHIMDKGKAEEHPYTQPAIIKNDTVCYSDDCAE